MVEFDPDAFSESIRPDDVLKYTAGWSAEQKNAWINWLEQAAHRKTLAAVNTHPAMLAQRLDPKWTLTPALDLISHKYADTCRSKAGRLLVSMPPQEGKLVDGQTPVPTPDGWCKHGELKPGDLVFHPSGRPIRVVAKHADAETQYRVHFSDHTSIDVHGAHEWTVYDRARRADRTVETTYLTTQKLRTGPEGRGGRYRFQLPFREALSLPPDLLPMDPYTLGVWLGDGTTSKPCITHHADDEYVLPYLNGPRHVHKDTGIVTSYYRMWQDLKETGVIGNKHIPAAFLRGSEWQRRSLLAGLIDTDGHVSKSGQVSFDNANSLLVHQTAELIRTLGYRAHVHRPTPAKMSSSGINGKQDMWRVTFSPHDEVPARLPRKVANFRPSVRRRVAITKVERLQTPGVGNCITVDSADGLYLVGEGWTPTHNSTLTSVVGSLWALQQNPDTRVMITANADSLAMKMATEARDWVSTHGAEATEPITGERMPDRLGFSLAAEKSAGGHWRVKGHKGGIYSAGVGGNIVGRPADLMVIDDPFKSWIEADSPLRRSQIWQWWEGNVKPRLAPHAPVIVVMTRWHEEDLAGQLELTGDWEVINIPAISEPEVPDALGRDPGVQMESAREGRDFFEVRRGYRGPENRTWSAQYMGRPTPSGGTLFSKAWFNTHRTPLNPTLYRRITTVDPAETGKSDEVGIMAGGLTSAGNVVLTDDASGMYTSDQWSIEAVLLALRTGSTELVFEAYTTETTYHRILREAWRQVATDPVKFGFPLGVWNPKSLPPFRIVPWRGKGNALARSSGLRQATSTGRCAVEGYKLSTYEEKAIKWQEGQHQPDRVAAATILFHHLAGEGGTTLAAPITAGGGHNVGGGWGVMPDGMSGGPQVSGF